MENSNIFDDNSGYIAREKIIIKTLISLAVLMIAGVVAYNAFFKKEIQGVDFSLENKKISTQNQKKSKTKRTINLNTASKKEIMENINGIGEKTATKIISYRKTNGGFKSKEEIMKIKGISIGKFKKIKNKITV
ncbi:MAG: helix-hairpin-helix domain-containing protein [Clostridia bacterium]|nr:helix-hairpin-helix domain-containing protein [Clostridia bacterium]